MTSTSATTENTIQPNYVLRTQSSHLYDDNTLVDVSKVHGFLKCDLHDRIMEVGDGFAAELFPDEAFGFPINDHFVKNFCGTFISLGKLFDPSNFVDESGTATFLNRMITTIACFLDSTKKTTLKPLRYFSDRHANTPMHGHPAKVKPDIVVAHLIDGCTREGRLQWKEVQTIIEHTRSKSPPKRMAETVSVKSYMAFCNQPDRDFIPFLCITGSGIHIVLTDHAGQIETDLIPFDRTATTLIFFRMVMGFTFLPDSYIGLDATISRQHGGVSSGKNLSKVYPPFSCDFANPTISLFLCDSSSCIRVDPPNIATVTSYPDSDNDNDGIVSISVGSTTYEVIRLIFRAQTLVGRATRAFLVKLPDGTEGVLKDSWIATNRATEATFLEGLDIPFGPQLVNHCVLRDTGSFRDSPLKMCASQECREKRRVVTYPAGVPISDFSSCWELMVAMLDVVVGIIDSPFLFDYSDFDILFQL
jgi:protein kinase-like protein